MPMGSCGSHGRRVDFLDFFVEKKGRFAKVPVRRRVGTHSEIMVALQPE